MVVFIIRQFSERDNILFDWYRHEKTNRHPTGSDACLLLQINISLVGVWCGDVCGVAPRLYVCDVPADFRSGHAGEPRTGCHPVALYG